MIFELITGDYLFDPESSSSYSKEDDHLALFTELMGFPESKYILSGKRSRKYYSTKGKLKRVKKIKVFDLSKTLIDKYHIKEEEAEPLSDFMLRVLRWNVDERESAA